MDWQAKFIAGLKYEEFLTKYGEPNFGGRWRSVFDRVALSSSQRELLGSFVREMNVLCLAGAWCGDCINQCPIFEHFACSAPALHLRFLDRDEHSAVQQELMINAGKRVPVLVFLSEDFQEVARYGERTLAQYRHMARDQFGPAYLTGLVTPLSDSLAAIVQDWLDEFERVQILLRLSPRLRQKHRD
jgi:thiol-disulfide isomerase/thioredoxin